MLGLVVSCALVVGCRERADEGAKDQGDGKTRSLTVANEVSACGDRLACARACDQGDAEQCRALGAAYQFAEGTDRDDAMAEKLYAKACDGKNAVACLSAGQMHEFAHGVPKDDGRAAALYTRGCELGYLAACANEAVMLENGRGVARDVGAARGLYAKACKAGASFACERGKALRTWDAEGP